MKKIIYAGLFVLLMAQFSVSNACTNFLFTKGATKDGSTMITYAADSHTLYGELYYRKAADYPEGTMFMLVDWDSGRKLFEIPQVAHTYSVVGNMNECQLPSARPPMVAVRNAGRTRSEVSTMVRSSMSHSSVPKMPVKPSIG